MPARGPLPDTYGELVSGPSRVSSDAWERRRWWLRALGAAAAFVLGTAILRLGVWAGLPGTPFLMTAPPLIYTPAALALGGTALWLAHDRWPVRSMIGQLEVALSRLVR